MTPSSCKGKAVVLPLIMRGTQGGDSDSQKGRRGKSQVLGVRDDLASSLFSCVRLSKDSSLVEPIALVATAWPRMEKRLVWDA